MPAFKTNDWGELEIPTIVLSTRYHRSLGVINAVDTSSINVDWNMNSAQEISFDVYKELNGELCNLWDKIVDFKYVFIPEFEEYYEIAVTIDEDNKTIKRVSGKSACEAELSQRILRNFECNTETDILREDYEITVFYDPQNPGKSLLNRVLADKCPDYSIAHVDSTIANIQRTFSADSTDIYSFLTTDVAEEIGCLFVFDSVERTISAYDLYSTCTSCGYRGEFTDICPKCGSRLISYGYGVRTNVFISSENFASSLSLTGKDDEVKNCFKIEGGDDLMTATVANINPSDSEYIYSFSNLMKEDMPNELVEKIDDYDTLYSSLLSTYEGLTEDLYEKIDRELYLQTEMMPEIIIPDTDATQELSNLENVIHNIDISVPDISVLSLTSADLAVNGMAKVIVDPRYTTDVFNTAITAFNPNEGYRTWTGKFKVKNIGLDDDYAESVSDISVNIIDQDYEEYLYQKIQKTILKKDAYFESIFKLDNMTDFREALTHYALDSLKSFESSYQACIEVLIEAGVTDETSVFYNVNLYEEMYEPYYERLLAIQAEEVVREGQLQVVRDEMVAIQNQRADIQEQLDFRKYLGDELWLIFCSYLREDTYSNSNYISDGLSNSELVAKAIELFEVAQKEIFKAKELQVELSMSLLDMLSTKEFSNFKQFINLGNWIICKINDVLYRLRIINIGVSYNDLSNLNVTFSNVTRIKDGISDVESVLNQAQSMASSYDYFAHQASNGEKAKASVNKWVEDGLSSALVSINSGDNQEIVIDEHGLTAKSWDDILGDYLPEQMKLTSNILAFTEDNWETCSLGLGRHDYTYYNATNHSFDTATGYGLSAKFVQSAYVYGSQIIGGDIYSTNYDSTHGTYINLDDGTFSFGGGKLTYDGTDVNINGTINATSGTISGFTLNSNGLSFVSTTTYSGYTSADVTAAYNFAYYGYVPTAAQLAKYDINADGEITMSDYYDVKAIVDHPSTYGTSKANVLLNSKSIKDTITITGSKGLANGQVTRMGVYSMSTKSVTANYITATEEISIKDMGSIRIGPGGSNESLLITEGSMTCYNYAIIAQRSFSITLDNVANFYVSAKYNTGKKLVFTSDGDLQVRAYNGTVLWHSNTGA